MRKWTFLIAYAALAFLATSSFARLSAVLAIRGRANPEDYLWGPIALVVVSVAYLMATVVAGRRGQTIGLKWLICFPLIAWAVELTPMITRLSLDVGGAQARYDALIHAGKLVKTIIASEKYPISFAINIACLVIGMSEEKRQVQIERIKPVGVANAEHYRAAFIATYVAVFSVPYVLGAIGVRELFSPVMIYGVPAISLAALVTVTWLRGNSIGKRWLFVLPLAAGLIGIAVNAITFMPGSPYYGGDGGGDSAMLAEMWFRIGPLAGLFASTFKIVAFFIGAIKFVPKGG